MSNWRIIGSTAMYHWFPQGINDLKQRYPKDIDLLTPAKISGNSKCIIDAQWHDAAQYLIDINKDKIFLDPDLLFTLKVSHAHWDIKWDKTLWDIYFLKQAGCKLNFEAYKLLFKVWENIHGKKKVYLNQDNDTFFTDAVNRKIDHDKLHEIVAFGSQPMHTLIRKDLSSALCSEELFNNLPFEDQCKTALEEIIVIAIERNRLDINSKQLEINKAINHAHKSLVTTMTTGWFARFLIINHYELIIERKHLWKTQISQALKNL